MYVLINKITKLNMNHDLPLTPNLCTVEQASLLPQTGSSCNYKHRTTQLKVGNRVKILNRSQLNTKKSGN